MNDLGGMSTCMANELKFYETKDDGKDYSIVHMECRATDWQIVFSVGVQHFDIGPAYPTVEEAEWFMNQFSFALGQFSGILIKNLSEEHSKTLDRQTLVIDNLRKRIDGLHS